MGQYIELKDYTDKSYLDYAMYVILHRALPHIGDGLKPVQRRIVYAMDELNLGPTAKYKKSARTIGDVLGKYHPHGDSACYEAMAMMAQPFSFRYPLVDGQGNWGSQDDPKSFAAMRYTEARLSQFSRYLLNDMTYKPVEMLKNFDGTLEEPAVLPAEVPTLLVNGVSGIAVGMATDIPPHNVSEVVRAVIHLIDNPDATLDDLMQVLPGPDFPTKARIISEAKEIRSAYAKGNGSIRMRCEYTIEKNEIVIHSLPFKVSGERVIEAIAEMIQAKKLPMIDDIQDQSDQKNPTRIVIKLKRSASDQAEKIMTFLLSKTDLEKSYRVNMNVLNLNGAPKVMGLEEILRTWLRFRVDTVKRRTEYQLKKIDAKIHITEGLLKAFLNLDEVIRIIREEDEPKHALCENLELSEAQADAVLNTRLAKLAKLEEMELRKEHEALIKEQGRLRGILKSEATLKARVRKELVALDEKHCEQFGNNNRESPIIPDESSTAGLEDLKELAPSEPATAVLSKNGYLRAGKGHQLDTSTLTQKMGDEHLDACATKTNRHVSLINSSGRTFSVLASELPSARGYGEPATNWIQPEAQTSWVTIMDPEAAEKWLMVGSEGYGFITGKETFSTRQKKGKVIMNKAGVPNKPQPIGSEDKVACLTNLGRLLVFPLAELPEIPKGKGVKLVGTKKGEHFVDATLVGEDHVLYLGYDNDQVVSLDPEQWQGMWEEGVGARSSAPKPIKDKKVPKGASFTSIRAIIE